jgi:hypothetical protein
MGVSNIDKKGNIERNTETSIETGFTVRIPDEDYKNFKKWCIDTGIKQKEYYALVIRKTNTMTREEFIKEFSI